MDWDVLPAHHHVLEQDSPDTWQSSQKFKGKAKHTRRAPRLGQLKTISRKCRYFWRDFPMRAVWRGTNGYIHLIIVFVCLSFVTLSLRRWFSTYTHHWILWAKPWIFAYPCGLFSREHHDINLLCVVFSDPTFFLIVLALGITSTTRSWRAI